MLVVWSRDCVYHVTHGYLAYSPHTLLAYPPPRHGGTYSHPYDLGAYKNLHAICGPHFFQWLLPHPPGIPGDGITYPTIWDSYHHNVVTVLPPVQSAGAYAAHLHPLRSVSGGV